MATDTVQAPPRQANDAESKAAAKVARVAGTTEARIAEKDAESARRLREREAELELHRLKADAKRDRRAARTADRDAKKARRADRSRARRAVHMQRLAAVRTRIYLSIAGNAPAVYSATIYAMALYVAVSGQISVAVDRGWPLILGIGMAAFLEGTALSMALTAHQLRLKGERAFAPRALTWVAAGFASTINFWAHRDDIVMAVVLGASSLAAIIVWEVRSGAKHRAALRKLGLIPDPPERFGWRRWFRYPRSTFAAWSLDVRSRVGTGAAALLAAVEEARAADTRDRADQAARDAQWGALNVALAAAQDAKAARAVAVDAVKTAARGPRRGLLNRFKRDAKPSEPDPVQVSARPATPDKKAPTKRTPQPKPSPRPSGDADKAQAAVEEAFVRLYADTGRRPGVRALEAAVRGAKKRSAIHEWMRKNPGRVEELSARAEAVRAGRSGEVSA